MKLVKLSAINSTNVYLKELLTKFKLDDYTVVVTDYQTFGKGQGVNKWHSEKGKNLLFSLLVRFDKLPIHKNAYLNFAISLGIYQVLKNYLPNVKIKWPNDIMAGNKKICGILIENNIRNSIISQSIIGVGLNVNQIIFPKELLNVTSLKKELNRNFDLSKLLKELIFSIKKQITILENNHFDELINNYELVLFKKGVLTQFKQQSTRRIFTGTIVGVSKVGLLKVLMSSDNSISEFANKELVFLV